MSAAERLGRAPPVAAENILFNDRRPTVTLLVEAGSDEAFWRAHVHPDVRVRHQGQGGRAAALRALDTPSAAVLVAALDADLDRLEGGLRDDPRVFWTDGHDLEATLLHLQPLLDRLLRRVQGHGDAEALRARLFAFASLPGRLRWLATRGDARARALSMDKLDHQSDRWSKSKRRWRELGAEVLTADPAALLSKLADWNSRLDLLAELPALREDLDALPEADPLQLCNGHDLISALWVWLHAQPSPRADDGSAPSRQLPPDPDALRTRLFDACERRWLEATRMWAAMSRWQGEHPHHPLLP